MPLARTLAATLLALAIPTAAATGQPAVNAERWPARPAPKPDPAIEARVERLMAAMTLEQKVGQVIQADISTVTPADVRELHLGSVLNGGNSAPGGNKRAKPAEWLALADAFWDASAPSGVPVIWGTDAVHGHSNLVGATIFPHNIGLGAARDPELVRRIAEATAAEVAATGLDWTFAPALSVAQDPRWGRTYESFSSDPALVARLGAAAVEGLQGRSGVSGPLRPAHVLATAKHFMGDGGTVGGKDQGDVIVDEATFRDLHGSVYPPALAAGAQTVMASYSSWRGQKMHGFGALLTGVLKGRFGFDGFVVGDWDAHAQLPGCTKESCPAAINAGVDMFMAPTAWRALHANTLAQVRSGEIPMARLDDAVRRILRVKVRSGLIDRGRPSSRPLAGRFELLGSAEHRALAREAVRRSLVLLKNERGLLPLRPRARVLVAGSAADSIPRQSGGWTITWQGTGTTNADFPGATTIWAGIRDAVTAAGGQAALSTDGIFADRPDVAVVVFGEQPYAEFEGDRPTLTFTPEGDVALLERLRAAGVPTVAVLLSGRPLEVGRALGAADAFVAAWLPGTEGAGVADLLFRAPDGRITHDFTGRLPMAWPRDPLPGRVLHPVGYGLGVAARR